MMKLKIILLSVFLIALLGEDVNAQKPTGDGRVITSAKEFLAFVKSVNKGALEYAERSTVDDPDPLHGDYSAWLIEEGGERIVKLGADITIPTTTAKKGAIMCWDGIFDGGGHTITIEKPTTPLFHSVFGTIRNLNIATTPGKAMDTFRDPATPGAVPFVGFLHGGTLSNCSSSIPVTQTAFTHTSMAGICLQAYDGVIEKCTNSGDLTVQLSGSFSNVAAINMGGIVCLVGDRLENAAFTSLTDPFVKGVKIIDCTNTGNVKLESTAVRSGKGTWSILHAGAGGIAGIITGGVNAPGKFAEITGCTNSGAVTMTETARSDGASGAGGIVGWVGPYQSRGNNIGKIYGSSAADQQDGFHTRITNCSNSGTIYNSRNLGLGKWANSYNSKCGTGGIAGLLFGGVTTPEGMAVISGCENTGTVKAGFGDDDFNDGSRFGMVGGIVGYGGGVAISRCVVKATLGDIELQAMSVGGIIGGAYNKFSVTDCKVDAQILRYNFNRLTSLPNFCTLVHGGSQNLTRNADGGGFKWMEGSEITDCAIKGSVTYKIGQSGTSATVDITDSRRNFNTMPQYVLSADDIETYIWDNSCLKVSGTKYWKGK